MHYLIARRGPAHGEPEYRVPRVGSEQRHVWVEAQPAKRCPVDHRAKLVFGREHFGQDGLLVQPCHGSPGTAFLPCRAALRGDLPDSLDGAAHPSPARVHIVLRGSDRPMTQKLLDDVDRHASLGHLAAR